MELPRIYVSRRHQSRIANPFNGITTGVEVRVNPDKLARIHSMELPQYTMPAHTVQRVAPNPFNGITTRYLLAFLGRISEEESIQWNYHLLAGAPRIFYLALIPNPFNGITTSRARPASQR